MSSKFSTPNARIWEDTETLGLKLRLEVHDGMLGQPLEAELKIPTAFL